MDDFAIVIHLTQASLGVGLVGGHDEDIVDPLAAAGSDVKAVSDHCGCLPHQALLSPGLQPLAAALAVHRLNLAATTATGARTSDASTVPGRGFRGVNFHILDSSSRQRTSAGLHSTTGPRRA